MNKMEASAISSRCYSALNYATGYDTFHEHCTVTNSSHNKKEDLILDLLEDSEAEAEDSCSINSEERGTVILQMLTDLLINAFASR